VSPRAAGARQWRASVPTSRFPRIARRESGAATRAQRGSCHRTPNCVRPVLWAAFTPPGKQTRAPPGAPLEALACRCGTGILPVFHGRDAHATRRCATGILPVFHGRDAHATRRCATGILPVFHGRDAHTTRRCATGILPVFHGRDAHATKDSSRASPANGGAWLHAGWW